MRLAVIPPEIVIALVVLIIFGVVLYVIIKLTRTGAVARDDLQEARRAEELQRRAEAAAEAERKKNEDLR